jgi:hypothetical protein
LQHGKKVLLKAHDNYDHYEGNREKSLKKGRVIDVRGDELVYDYNSNRDPNDRTISNSYFITKKPVDEHYTIQTIDGVPTVVDLE